MFIAKQSLSRRTVLRGIGASLALPFLNAMAPAQTRLASAPKRLACIEMVHGAAGSTDEGAAKHYWSPRNEGPAFQFSYSLEPLAALRDYITIVSGTDARQADAFMPSEGGADHFRSSAVFLTAAHAKQGPDICNGVSIDQIYAQKQDTRLPSMQLCIENIGLSGSCGFDYSCIYSETISWASPTEPLPMEVNPRIAFEKLFGSTASGSILDSVAEDRAGLKNNLGPGDRARVDTYLEQVRAIEKRIQNIEKENATALARKLPAAPLGVPDSWEKHVELMFDLQLLAFATDTTRVSTFKMSRDTSNRVFPESGVKSPFHTLSHHSERPDEIAEFAKLNRYHVGLVAKFLEKLKATPDGDGNLLDHSLILYGSPMGDSNTHNHKRLPVFLAGHAGGTLKGSFHSVSKPGTPHANTLLTILRKLGIEAASFGDSTGEVSV